MACLPDPRAAANRIKRVLHAIFEATFNFDLEDLRRRTSARPSRGSKARRTTPFVVSYVVQAALGGHAIPIDAGTMAALRVFDLVTEKDAAAGVVPGLERAVAKSKGIEFGSLLHELGPTIPPIRTPRRSATFCCKSTRSVQAACPSGGSIVRSGSA